MDTLGIAPAPALRALTVPTVLPPALPAILVVVAVTAMLLFHVLPARLRPTTARMGTSIASTVGL